MASTPLRPGDPAPHFALPTINREGQVSLDDYRGRSSVWSAWSPPCGRAPLAPGATARRGGVLAPSRGPRVRHDPVQAESAEKGCARPIVYGHRDVARNFDRYKKTIGWNTAINRRQFALPLERWRFPEDFRYSDVTCERRLTFRQGALSFELHHARGETEDATWVWVPEIRILHPGDLFIWAVPNAGNPQKVQR